MYYIHVNRNKINTNTKNGSNVPAQPAIRYQKGKYGKPVYCMKLQINGSSKMVYSPHTPLLPCGARLVIESELEPTVIA